jgi:predicted neutral ceramidase superfamily lipid hydrolase
VAGAQNGEGEMIESLYGLLNQVGFTHPLHPAITHLPMGMAMGAFLFSVGSLRYGDLAKTARHCAILGVIFVPPTMLLGILDWQYFYQGEWTTHIVVKFVLAITLAILFIAAIKVGGGEPKDSRLPILLYALCFLAAVGLGFTGGEIQYG